MQANEQHSIWYQGSWYQLRHQTKGHCLSTNKHDNDDDDDEDNDDTSLTCLQTAQNTLSFFTR